MDLSAFMDEFKSEAFEHLERIDQGLLILEQTPNNLAQVRNLFLSAHTIKGGAAMLSLTSIKEITHAFEDILDDLREGKYSASHATISILLKTADLLREVVARVPQEPTPEEIAWGKYLRLWPNIPALEAPPIEIVGIEIPIPEPVQALKTTLEAKIIEASTSEELLESTPPPQTLSNPTQPNPKNALLLEPSPTAQLWLRWQLEQVGFSVQCCETLEQAQKIYTPQSFALVVGAWEPAGIQPQEWMQQLGGSRVITTLVPLPLDFSTKLDQKLDKLDKGSWQNPTLLEWLQDASLAPSSHQSNAVPSP
jgi:chemotaxis protein histidine kinase CheA